MNSQQVGEVLAYFSAAWPKHEMYEETVQIWVDQFRDTDFEVAQKAARQLVASQRWFPSVNAFRQEIRSVSRRIQLEQSGVRRELEEPVGDWRRGLEQARQVLGSGDD